MSGTANSVKHSIGNLRSAIVERMPARFGELGHRPEIQVERQPDPIDDIPSRFAREFAITSLGQESEQLAALDAAIKRIDEGRFGVCAECGHVISAKRLIAVPWAALCVNCQYRADSKGDERLRASVEPDSVSLIRLTSGV